MINIKNLVEKIITIHNNIIAFESDAMFLQQDAVLSDVSPDFIAIKELLDKIEENHFLNSQLWLTEDKARRDDKGYEFVYNAKRTIDILNQKRNDAIANIDNILWFLLSPASINNCATNSETPGMIIDRISILSLKEYYMAMQTNRTEVSQEHIQLCQQKLKQIKLQKNTLVICLSDFLNQIQQKTRTFITFNAFKMYNDPNLNPELYKTIHEDA